MPRAVLGQTSSRSDVTVNTAPQIQREIVAHCPICRSHNRSKLFVSDDWLYKVEGEFPVVRCVECGLVYLGERPDARSLQLYYPDETYYAYRTAKGHSLFSRGSVLASVWYLMKRSLLAYDYNYGHLGGSKLLARIMRMPFAGALRNRATFRLEALLHPYIKDGNLLEVGCGSGDYLDLMRALGWKRVVGVDISAKAVHEARKTLGLEVYCGDLKHTGLDAGSFDAVSMSHTLEHVSDPIELLKDVRRMLKPGGRLSIIVPHVEGLCSRIFVDYWLGLEPPRHLVNFTRRSLALALESAGFAIQRLTTTPRGAYKVALFSHSRRAGDDHSIYTDAGYRFSIARCARALAISLLERAACAVRLPAGEELVAVAIRPV